MGSKYAQGRAFEYRASAALIEAGWVVVRSAGSRGEHGADLVALRSGGRVVIVQAKLSGDISVTDWNKIYNLAQWVGERASAVLVERDWKGSLKWSLLLGERVRYARERPCRSWSPQEC